jgi:hypothetical protein
MRAKTQSELGSTPTHILLSPSDNNNILNFINFNNLGSTTLGASTAFKKIQSASKTNPQSLFSNSSDYSLKYNKIYDLYLTELSTQDNLMYGINRQHNYSSSASLLNNLSTQLDNDSVAKFLDYNYSTLKSTKYTNSSNTEILVNLDNKNFNQNTTNLLTTQNSIASTEVDSMNNLGQEAGSVKKGIDSVAGLNIALSNNSGNLKTYNSKLNTTYNLFNYSLFYKIFSHRSPNQQILSSDRNIRNYDTLNPNKVNYNISSNENNLGQNNNQLGHIYFSSNTVMPQQHIPSSALGTKFTNISYDRYTSKGMNSSLMTAKEELAPNFIFTPYWDSILSNTSVSNRLNTLLNYDELQGSLSLPNIIEYNEYDFKN